MVRVGAPFQYKQFGGMLSVQNFFWKINFFTKFLLHKITNGITPPPIFLGVCDPDKKYSSIWNNANRLSSTLWTIVVGSITYMTCIKNNDNIKIDIGSLPSWIGKIGGTGHQKDGDDDDTEPSD